MEGEQGHNLLDPFEASSRTSRGAVCCIFTSQIVLVGVTGSGVYMTRALGVIKLSVSIATAVPEKLRGKQSS